MLPAVACCCPNRYLWRWFTSCHRGLWVKPSGPLPLIAPGNSWLMETGLIKRPASGSQVLFRLAREGTWIILLVILSRLRISSNVTKPWKVSSRLFQPSSFEWRRLFFGSEGVPILYTTLPIILQLTKGLPQTWRPHYTENVVVSFWNFLFLHEPRVNPLAIF